MTKQRLADELGRALQSWACEATSEGLRFSGSYSFPPDFPAFAGHFPERAVLPAIVQLALVRQLAELALAKKLLTRACQRTKFRLVVGVDQLLAVQGHLRAQDNGWQAEFSLSRQDEQVAAGRLFLEEQ